jgi:hypothetical protein
MTVVGTPAGVLSIRALKPVTMAIPAATRGKRMEATSKKKWAEIDVGPQVPQETRRLDWSVDWAVAARILWHGYLEGTLRRRVR